MIYIGLEDGEKKSIIERYRSANDIRQIVVISADAFPMDVTDSQQVEFSQVIMYRVFYPMMQTIDHHTLLILNEVLRTQNRYDLAYNCIRNFLNQTTHQLVFQQLPQIDTVQDFMILFDFDTRSRWKREKFDVNLVMDNARIEINRLPLTFRKIDVPTREATQRKYTKERERRFANIGARDPHTIPRNLHLIGGKDKLAWIDAQGGKSEQINSFGDVASGQYVARNQRLKRDYITTYANVKQGGQYRLIDFPHRFIDFSDFIKTTGQTTFEFLAANLKVDDWYFSQYQAWKERIYETYSSLE